MKKIVFAIILAIVFFTLSFSVVAATEVTVTLPSFDVVINGQLIDEYEHQNLQYPLYVYKDITYFPMTYFDCATLGIYNYWTPETGNVITSGLPCAEYTEIFATSPKGKTATAYIADTKINVNGIAVDNATEEYPILNCNNVLYFPLTWKWTSEFGWINSFQQTEKIYGMWSVLAIYTDDCPYMNKVWYYDYVNGFKKTVLLSKFIEDTYLPGNDFSVLVDDYSAYVDDRFEIWRNDEKFSYTDMYAESRFGSGKGGYEAIENYDTKCVLIPNNLVDEYKKNGWKTYYDYWKDNTHYLEYIKQKRYYDGMKYYNCFLEGAMYQTWYDYLSGEDAVLERIENIATAWKNDINKSVACHDYYLYDSDNDGKKDTVRLYFVNLTDQTINAIKLFWDCMDVFGEPIVKQVYNENGAVVTRQDSQRFNAYVSDEYISSYKIFSFDWDVSSYSGIARLENITVEKIVFADGTIVNG